MNVYRVPPSPLPSLRDILAEEQAIEPWARGPRNLEQWQWRMASEPFEHDELRRERAAKEAAAAHAFPPLKHVPDILGRLCVFWCPECKRQATIVGVVTGC